MVYNLYVNYEDSEDGGKCSLVWIIIALADLNMYAKIKIKKLIPQETVCGVTQSLPWKVEIRSISPLL